ncbi:hypothetical protein SAMN06265373_11195 [Shimia sagamensis]|uniref:Uncharacterized protein n=1 Tax=Shimia sagamensis TaxID=1566352 RepID=A0ABY1PJ09_9RHOB|nr:hypothetical protein SAMN06265373_11195 [Shimia sagamensis]
MRAIILTMLIIFANTTQAPAQTMPTMPPTASPEIGTFCGFLKRCPKASAPKSDD